MSKSINSTMMRSAEFSFIEQGILKIRLIEGAEIDIEESKLMQKTSLLLTEGKKFVAFVDARVNVIVTKDAREWGSTAEAQKNMLAQAVLVNSTANKLVGNFIIQFHKPVAKTRLFSDEETALEWLREQKIKLDVK